VTAVATHPGGPFYEWYRGVYGYAPPPTVDNQACRYIAWTQGWPRNVAAGIPYGTIGNCGVYAAGGAILPPPPPPPPAPISPVLGTIGGAILPPAPGAPSPVAGLIGPGQASEPPPVSTMASVPTTRWYAVVASRESLGGIGSCRPIEPRGYSELSIDPARRDFRALGGLRCLTGIYVRNPATGAEVGAVKQDVGAGSGFLPSMGLYPQTIADIGMDVTAGEFHVQIRRQDGAAMNIPRSAIIDLPNTPAASGPAATPAQRYFNPLAHAQVTAERIDQGVDYAGSGYLVAIADGIITQSVANGSGWEGEGYIEYQITQPGELQGAFVYYAEGVNTVVRDGWEVKGGSRLCDLRSPMPHGIEIGFAAGNGEESYYRYHDGSYHEGDATRPGIAMSNLIERLGGPGGRIEGAIVGHFPSYVPSGEFGASVNTSGATPSTLGRGQPFIPAPSAAAGFHFPGDYYSAFVQLQRGANNGSHHSHAAAAYVAGVTYLTKAD
jgi:hypothetical protein